MFCGCELSFGDPPNTHTCPVCLGLPGALPVVNARAIHFGIMIGLALGCEIAERSLFHRKNYFYPDLPKGYQISQYDVPLCRGGRLGDVRIHRVHLEEDAAKLDHLGTSGRIHGSDRSWVDFNRGGHAAGRDRDRARSALARAGARMAGAAADHAPPARRLRREHGGGVAARRRQRLGPAGGIDRARHQDRAQEHELVPLPRARRAGRDRAARSVCSSTASRWCRRRCTSTRATDTLTPLRSKEEAHDYRYFPEPDLVPILATEEMLAAARADLPAELPAERAARFEHELGLNADTARLFAFRTELGDYFERALAAAGGNGEQRQVDPVELANWIPQLVERIGSDTDPAGSNVAPESLATLATMVKAKEVSRDAAREVLTRLVAEGGDPRAIVEREGLGALTAEDDGLGELVDRAIASDPAAAEQVRSGNMKAIGPLVGYVMRETKGRADGGEITRLIRERLGD